LGHYELDTETAALSTDSQQIVYVRVSEEFNLIYLWYFLLREYRVE